MTQAEADSEKLIFLVSNGVDPNGIEETWAWNNFEEAKKMIRFFESFISILKPI